MKTKETLTYKTKDLEFYIKNAISKSHAIKSFLYYRIGVTENDIELFEGKIPDKAAVMEAIELETKETSTREQAIAWWKQYNFTKQCGLMVKYKNLIVDYPGKSPTALTGREIEEIWRKENKIDEDLEIWYNAHKPNQKQLPKQYSQEEVDRLLDEQAAKTTAYIFESKKKQFKQANPELINAYFNKFSKEDLYKIHLPILIALLNPLDYKEFVLNQQVTG